MWHTQMHSIPLENVRCRSDLGGVSRGETTSGGASKARNEAVAIAG